VRPPGFGARARQRRFSPSRIGFPKIPFIFHPLSFILIFVMINRFCLIAALLPLWLPWCVRAGERAAQGQPLVLWYRQPAAKWVEALPLGNGRLGAMVFGGVPQERLQLNEDTLYAGGPYDPDNPGALAALPEVRRLIFVGQYAEAQSLAKCLMKRWATSS
jgi:hypothetical protein